MIYEGCPLDYLPTLYNEQQKYVQTFKYEQNYTKSKKCILKK